MAWRTVLKSNFKDAVFNTDRELIEFKRELRNIKQDEEERYQKIKHKPEDDSYAKRRRKANIEKKRLFLTIEHIEDYLNNHLRQYPVLNEQQKIGVVDWFTKDSLMNALERYKTRYIEKLADFMYDKYGATIPTSKLNELGIDGTFNKSFKDTVFHYDRDIHQPLTRLRTDMEDIREMVIWIIYGENSQQNFRRIRNTYKGHFYDGGKEKEEPEEWLSRYKDSQEEVISEVESIIREISQESDKKKREELVDSLMSDSILQRMDKSVLNPYTLAINRILRRLGSRPAHSYYGIVSELREKHDKLRKEYLLSQGYKKEYADVVFTKSFKDAVFGYDRDLIKLKNKINYVLGCLIESREQDIKRELDDRRRAIKYGGTRDIDGNFIDFKDPKNKGLIPSINRKDLEREIPNHPKQLKEQIPLIMSHLDEIKNEQDEDKKEKLIDEIIYPIDFKGTGRFPNGVAVAIVEYIGDADIHEDWKIWS